MESNKLHVFLLFSYLFQSLINIFSMSESKPLLSTVQTRQVYLACPETLDPLYHKPADSNSIHRCSSLSQSIRSVGPDDAEFISSQRRMSHDSTTDTLHDFMVNEEGEEDDDEDMVDIKIKSQRQPTDSVAYVQRLEKFFDLFSSSLYLENTVAVARDHMGMFYRKCLLSLNTNTNVSNIITSFYF
jgi:hypothetical protein